MIKLMKSAIVSSAILAGCAGGPQPAPVGKDTYMLSSSTTWTFKAGAELLSGLYFHADEFCREHGKVSSVVNTNTGDGGVALNAHAELIFRCLAENDSENTRPDVRQSPTVVIEDQRKK